MTLPLLMEYITCLSDDKLEHYVVYIVILDGNY